MKTWLRVLILWAVSFSSLAWAAEPRPYLMAVLGDSISAGTLADVPVPAETPAIKPQIVYSNPYTLSWAAGKKISSHFEKLSDYLKKSGDAHSLDVLNAALPGAQTADLERQAEWVAQVMGYGHHAAVLYVTLLIGANDACSDLTPTGTPQKEMHDEILTALRTLAAIPQKEKIHVLLVGLPKIPDLGMPSIRDSRTLFGMQCQTLRNKILGFCNTLVTWTTQSEFQEKMDIVEEKNRLLRDLAPEASKLIPKLEVVYSQRLYDFEIPRNLLAADCFHPNGTGQQEIADQLWMDQPWFQNFALEHPASTLATNATPCERPQITVQAPSSISQGQEIDFTVTIKNQGSCDFHSLNVMDYIPAETEFIGSVPSCSIQSGGNPPQSPHSEWDNVDLPAGGELKFEVRSRSLSPAGRTITNTACFEQNDLGRLCNYSDTLSQ